MICVVPRATAEAAATLTEYGFFQIGEVGQRKGPDRVLLR